MRRSSFLIASSHRFFGSRHAPQSPSHLRENPEASSETFTRLPQRQHIASVSARTTARQQPMTRTPTHAAAPRSILRFEAVLRVPSRTRRNLARPCGVAQLRHRRRGYFVVTSGAGRSEWRSRIVAISQRSSASESAGALALPRAAGR